MIVTCAQCQTQFRLDDSQVGAAGLRVRCSLCKHSFLVEPEDSRGGAERFHALARDAVSPAATEDLVAPSQDSAEPSGEQLPGEQLPGEQDWQFNDATLSEEETQPAGPGPAAQPPPARTREVAQRAVDELLAEESDLASEELGEIGEIGLGELGAEGDPGEGIASLDIGEEPARDERTDPGPAAPAPGLAGIGADLGSPESWNFFEGVSPEATAAPSAVAPAAAERPLDLPAQLPALEAELAMPVRWPGRVGEAIGWLTLTALMLAGLHGGLSTPAGAGPGAAALGGARSPGTQVRQLAGLEVAVERARFVENVQAGPIYAVSGTLRNRGGRTAPGAWLQLRFLDRTGQPLPAAAPLGPPLSARELREWPPEQIREAQLAGAQRLAQVPLRPDERWLFDAVLLEVPAAAARFQLEAADASRAVRAPADLRPGASPR